MMDRRSSFSPTGTPYFDCQPTVANAAACGSLVDGNVTYVLAGIHFHAPSENTRDGHAFPVEMHMVRAV
jgi:carbonic anhydrase